MHQVMTYIRRCKADAAPLNLIHLHHLQRRGFGFSTAVFWFVYDSHSWNFFLSFLFSWDSFMIYVQVSILAFRSLTSVGIFRLESSQEEFPCVAELYCLI